VFAAAGSARRRSISPFLLEKSCKNDNLHIEKSSYNLIFCHI
jgi:hypothetical protein